MRYDFSDVEDADSFVSVPEGEYVCRVTEVREGQSREGAPRWNLRLEVIEGEWAGRTAAWDSLTWSQRGIHRVKLVLTALGLDTRGELEIDSQELVGLEAHVRLMLEEREDPLTGRRQMRLRVPYQGYRPRSEAGALQRERGMQGGLRAVDADGTPGE